MNGNSGKDFIRLFKKIISLKRTQITLYIAAILWLAVGTQIIVNQAFKKDFQITEAFVKTNTEEMQSSIEVLAQYGSEYLSETEKKELIYYIANAIGLTIDKEITVQRDDERSEYSFYKYAKRATSEIKVISIEKEEDSVVTMKHYIVVKLTILQSVKNVDHYRNLLNQALGELDIEDQQITLQYEGSIDGELSSEEKSELAYQLVGELQGELVIEYDEGDLYTVYGYTGMLGEYIVSMDSKINIHVAISYNELTDKTKIYLATPILNQNW